jgi:hypothetical protein
MDEQAEQIHMEESVLSSVGKGLCLAAHFACSVFLRGVERHLRNYEDHSAVSGLQFLLTLGVGTDPRHS